MKHQGNFEFFIKPHAGSVSLSSMSFTALILTLMTLSALAFRGLNLESGDSVDAVVAYQMKAAKESMIVFSIGYPLGTAFFGFPFWLYRKFKNPANKLHDYFEGICAATLFLLSRAFLFYKNGMNGL